MTNKESGSSETKISVNVNSKAFQTTLLLSTMAVAYMLPVLFSAVFVGGFILLAMAAINFDLSNSEIPPGVTHPVKLRIIHITSIATAVVVSQHGGVLGEDFWVNL